MSTPPPSRDVRVTVPGNDVLAEQIGLVIRNGIAGGVASLVVSLLYAGVMWPVVQRTLLIAWLITLNAIGLARVVLAWLHRRSRSRKPMRVWTTATFVLAAASGLGWGFAAVALFPLGRTDLHIVAGFLLIGVPAAALTTYGPWWPAFAAYVVASVGPFCAWMFASSEPVWVVTGLAGLLFVAFVLRQGITLTDTVRRSIEHRLQLQSMTASLRQARDSAEAANRAKSGFLANVSHELRTPLNAVVGLSDLLIDEPDGRRGRELAATIRQSAQSLLGVIDDVVDLARIESGKLELRARNFDPRSVLREVSAMFTAEAQRRRLSLRLDVDGGVPPAVVADPDRLRQILVNLLDNALKFTEAGSVSVNLTAATRGDGRYVLRFEVVDTGVGIAAAERARLFTAFAQGDASVRRPADGPGLGLSIAAALVKLMGGEIGFNSESGSGTTFWFTVSAGLSPPTMREVHVDAPVPTTQTLTPRILVVEDNETNLMLTQRMLESLGCRVQLAKTGAEGLARLQSEAFDLVFMDVNMPGIDGFEATRVWREHEESRDQRLPIVALTANAMAGDRQQCIAAGMDDYLAKPVTMDALRRMVARHVPATA